MNPYNPNPNQPYNFPQQTPGPPQPPWKAPAPAPASGLPRRSGWADPRFSQPPPSPVSPPYNHTTPNLFGPSVPVPAPPLAQGQYDTSAWGVRYNHPPVQPPPPLFYQDPSNQKPPLPPRPSSAAGPGPASPGPQQPEHDHHSHNHNLNNNYSSQPQPQPQPSQHYPTSWSDPYQTHHGYNPHPQTPAPGPPPPPPPPPRPAEYQAQIEAQHQHHHPHNTSVSGPEYSHRPTSHHYDPPPPFAAGAGPAPGLWGTEPQPPVPPFTHPAYPPTAPPPQQFSATVDGPLVSPVESTTGLWGRQGQGLEHTSTSTAARADQNTKTHDYQTPKMDTRPGPPGHAQALGSGGPSDWEHYEPSVPSIPENTPESPVPRPVERLAHSPSRHDRVSSIQSNITPNPSGPPTPPAAEVGVPSPVSPRRSEPPPPAHAHPHQPDTAHVGPTTQSHINRRSSSSSGQISGGDTSKESANGSGDHDNASLVSRQTPSQAPQQSFPSPAREEVSSRPGSRASGARLVSPSPEHSPVTSVRVVDPYADLEPEFKASLNRYAAMLRKESAAETDQEKFDIFHSFATKELRLRSLLYGVELNKEKEQPKEVKKAASLAEIQEILPNAVAAVPLNLAEEITQQAQKTSDSVSAETQGAPSLEMPSKDEPAQQPPSSDAGSAEQPESASAQPNQFKSPVQRPSITTAVNDPGRTMADSGPIATADGDDEEEAYSPGGRPMLHRNRTSRSSTDHVQTATVTTATTGTPWGHEAVPNNQSHRDSPRMGSVSSPGADAPMVTGDYATLNPPPSPGSNAPILVVPESPEDRPSSQAGQHRSSAQQQNIFPQARESVAPIKFEPPRPVYTPFRYNAAVQEEIPKSLQPADQAYSSLRHSAADSGRLMAQEAMSAPARPASAIGRKEHEEAFIGLIRQQSMAVRQQRPASVAGMLDMFRPGLGRTRGSSESASKSEPPLAIRVGTPTNSAPVVAVDPLTQAITALRAVLPTQKDQTSLDSALGHPKLKTIKAKIDNVPDQFGFIRDKVVEWDRTNREVRKQQEAERRSRQEESEAHIDALFNDNEIGYADIGDLETEFKLAEAERHYQENKEELESFTAQVFAPVTERLEKETAELTTTYTLAIDLLDLESVAASGYLKSNKEKPLMAEVMRCLLVLSEKIEVRYRKVAEAHVERERRRKHLELTVLYTNGDTAGVKRVESDFAVAEKTQVLHEARGKDTRANRLMDAFDRATVRGLGDNQTYIDDMLAKIQQLKKAILSAGPTAKDQMYGADGARDTLSSAQTVVDTVAADSRKLLALSNEAEMLLNDADYAVSVAEARVANADKETYHNLELEKAKEDAKLAEEMEARISSVTKVPSEASALIQELIDRIGEDPEHQERIKKALEAAKQRNTSTPVPPGP
ncbi:hypothetical protein KCU88_g2444, partial [Aureobasidium melanogenum]